MKRNKKKLPRFYDGKPSNVIDPGYLRNYGIGLPQTSSEQGENLEPTIKAARRNIYPGAFNTAQQSAQFLAPMVSGIHSVTPTITTTLSAPGLSAVPGITHGGIAGGLGSLTGGAAVGETAAKTVTTTLPTLHIVSAAAKGLGVLGGLYGLANMGMLFGEAGDHRTSGQMISSAPRNTYSTAGGNQYKTYGGINLGNELKLNDYQAKSRQLNFGLNSIGTGASIGGIFGLPGMAIGAGIGSLVGALGSLFGFGDNEDDIRWQQRLGNDAIAGYNRMSKSVSESKDLEAANGKQPVYTPFGRTHGKATAKVSNGELIGNFEDGYVSRVPGIKNNNDTVSAALKPSDWVISNKYGLSDLAVKTGDYAGVLNLLEMLMNNKYKNGKMPRYWLGKAGEYALATFPHFGLFFTNLRQYNEDKSADIYAPDPYVNNYEGARAVNELGKLRFDVNPYIADARRGLNQANWNVRRNVGLGIGGRAIAQNVNYLSYLDALAKMRTQENEANNKYKAMYANALQELGTANQARRIDSNVRRNAQLQQANATRYGALVNDRKNMVMAGLNGAADLLRMGQYNDSLGIQKKMLKLYEQGVENDKIKTLAYIDSLGNNKATAASASMPLSFMVNMIKTPLSRYGFVPSMLKAINRPVVIKYKNGKIPKYEDGLVDTRSDTTYQGYNPNPIPWGAGLDAAGQSPLALLDGIEAASLISNNPYLLTGIAPSPGKVTYTPEQMTKLWLKYGQEYARKNKLSTFMGPNGKMYAHMPNGKVRSFEAIGKEIRGEEPITYTAKKFKPVDHTIKKLPKVISTSKKTYNYGAITANDFK